jgi:hypothetical protein
MLVLLLVDQCIASGLLKTPWGWRLLCSTKGFDALGMCSLGPQLAVDLVAQIDGMDKDKGKLTEVGTQHIYRNARISAITRDNAMLDTA